MDEPNVPQWLVDRLNRVLPTLLKYLPTDSLKMGGGTTLRCRWNHRISYDIDLFVDSSTFNTVISKSANDLENALYQIEGLDVDRSWVEPNVIYCEVDEIEVTVMPTDSLVAEDSGYVIPNTRVKTESTATILHKKIVGRMIASGAIEIWDVYDLYTAIEKDPNSLQRAIQPIPERSLVRVATMLQVLPSRWLGETTQPLLGVKIQPSAVKMKQVISVFFKNSKFPRN